MVSIKMNHNQINTKELLSFMKENLFCMKENHWTIPLLLKRFQCLWMTGYLDSSFRIVVERLAALCT